MFLLIRICFIFLHRVLEIYIPLCFYLYPYSIVHDSSMSDIYIPLCFYLYSEILCFHPPLYETFTFHYVSTYTILSVLVWRRWCIYIPLCFYLYRKLRTKHTFVVYLHSTMFLLIPARDARYPKSVWIYIPLCFYLYKQPWINSIRDWTHLHSTMFLLIRWFWVYYFWWSEKFTFHYVSTYTKLPVITQIYYFNLHSTMFLLIPGNRCAIENNFIYLHSTMFLLIRRQRSTRKKSLTFIYIPLCFYLYQTSKPGANDPNSIYIPLCFYLYCACCILTERF